MDRECYVGNVFVNGVVDMCTVFINIRANVYGE